MTLGLTQYFVGQAATNAQIAANLVAEDATGALNTGLAGVAATIQQYSSLNGDRNLNRLASDIDHYLRVASDAAQSRSAREKIAYTLRHVDNARWQLVAGGIFGSGIRRPIAHTAFRIPAEVSHGSGDSRVGAGVTVAERTGGTINRKRVVPHAPGNVSQPGFVAAASGGSNSVTNEKLLRLLRVRPEGVVRSSSDNIVPFGRETVSRAEENPINYLSEHESLYLSRLGHVLTKVVDGVAYTFSLLSFDANRASVLVTAKELDEVDGVILPVLKPDEVGVSLADYRADEANHLRNAVNESLRIMNSEGGPQRRIIVVAGPKGSGKSDVVAQVKEELEHPKTSFSDSPRAWFMGLFAAPSSPIAEVNVVDLKGDAAVKPGLNIVEVDAEIAVGKDGIELSSDAKSRLGQLGITPDATVFFLPKPLSETQISQWKPAVVVPDPMYEQYRPLLVLKPLVYTIDGRAFPTGTASSLSAASAPHAPFGRMIDPSESLQSPPVVEASPAPKPDPLGRTLPDWMKGIQDKLPNYESDVPNIVVRSFADIKDVLKKWVNSTTYKSEVALASGLALEPQLKYVVLESEVVVDGKSKKVRYAVVAPNIVVHADLIVAGSKIVGAGMIKFVNDQYIFDGRSGSFATTREGVFIEDKSGKYDKTEDAGFDSAYRVISSLEGADNNIEPNLIVRDTLGRLLPPSQVTLERQLTEAVGGWVFIFHPKGAVGLDALRNSRITSYRYVVISSGGDLETNGDIELRVTANVNKPTGDDPLIGSTLAGAFLEEGEISIENDTITVKPKPGGLLNHDQFFKDIGIE